MLIYFGKENALCGGGVEKDKDIRAKEMVVKKGVPEETFKKRDGDTESEREKKKGKRNLVRNIINYVSFPHLF